MPGDLRSLLAILTTIQELDEAIAGGAKESRLLEFRGLLPKGPDPRTRFLRTATAFANTDGGVIVFGVQKAADGDYKAGGLQGFDSDAAQRNLGQTLLTGTEPPPKVAQPLVLSAPDRAPVLVYPIPQSLSRPHAVLEQSDRATFRSYWRRGDGYNFGMATGELRDSFLEYEHWLAESARFRAERVQAAVQFDGRLGLLSDRPHVFAHVVPLGRRDRLDFSTRPVSNLGAFFNVPSLTGFQDRANVEGWLRLSPLGGDGLTWVQCFRNGAIEFACGCRAAAELGGPSATRLLRGKPVEDRLVQFIGAAMRWLQLTQVAPPYAVSLAITGAKGIALWAPDTYLDFPGVIDRDVALLDEMVIDSLPEETDNGPVAVLVRPALNMLWQASGYERSPYFDADGTRRH